MAAPLTPAKRHSSNPLSQIATESVKHPSKQRITSWEFSDTASSVSLQLSSDLNAETPLPSSPNPRRMRATTLTPRTPRGRKASVVSLEYEGQSLVSVPLTQSTLNTLPSSLNKQKVKEREKNKCWLCGIGGPVLEAAHLFPKADSNSYISWYENGCLPPEMRTLGHIANLVLLCSNCHGGFDLNPPVWIMVPEDLDFFIDWENRDWEERMSAPGDPPPRSVPGIGNIDYKGKFVPYIFTQVTVKQLLRGSDRMNYPREYLGSPTAAIIQAYLGHAAANSGGKGPVNVWDGDGEKHVVVAGLPSEVKDKLRKLGDLWGREMFELLNARQESQRKLMHEGSEPLVNNDDEAHGMDAATVTRQAATADQPLHLEIEDYQVGRRQMNVEPKVVAVDTLPPPILESKKNDEVPPEVHQRNKFYRNQFWGPESTSNDKIKAATGVNTVNMMDLRGRLEEKDSPSGTQPEVDDSNAQT